MSLTAHDRIRSDAAAHRAAERHSSLQRTSAILAATARCASAPAARGDGSGALGALARHRRARLRSTTLFSPNYNFS